MHEAFEPCADCEDSDGFCSKYDDGQCHDFDEEPLCECGATETGCNC